MNEEDVHHWLTSVRLQGASLQRNMGGQPEQFRFLRILTEATANGITQRAANRITDCAANGIAERAADRPTDEMRSWDDQASLDVLLLTGG